MKNLKVLINRAIMELESVGITTGYIIDIKTAPNTNQSWGYCRKRPDGFEIKINECLLEDNVDDKATMDTVMHEVIHTVDGCLNHKAPFKKVAALVNERYGYNVKRISSAAEKGIDKSDITTIQYIIECGNCGNLNYYSRKTKVVKSILNKEHSYRCSCCKSDDLFVKEA